jgi:cytochrome c
MAFNHSFVLAFAILSLTACSPSTKTSPSTNDDLSVQDNHISMADKSVFVFSKTLGWRHKSIPAGQALFRRLADDNNFSVTFSEDSTDFTRDKLAKYDAVVFLNTSGPILMPEQQDAFKTYIQNGGGFVGVHSATDTHIKIEWPWFIDLVGGKFESHPNEPSNVQAATLFKTAVTHPATEFLPASFEWSDEWYDFERLYGGITPVLTIDRQSYQNAKTQGITPIAWAHEYDGGRSFYTNLGHDAANYTNEKFEQHILGGLHYVVQGKTR